MERLSGWLWLCGCCALMAGVALGQGQKCGSTEYEWEGRCCKKCSPGHKLRTECAGEAETVCDPCGLHHFQSTWTREKHCTPHQHCDENAGLVVEVPGTATQNVACRCKEGTRCSGPECQTCRVNKPCGPGEGVQKEASGSNDTVCVTCPHGYFSNSLSATDRCRPWSSCEAKQLIKKENGTRESDVVCADVQTLPESKGEPQRIYSLLMVVVSLAAVGILGVVAALFLWRPNRKELQKPVNGGPVEMDDVPEDKGHTLLQGHPVAQEDGKDSRLSEEEHLCLEV